MLLTTILLTLNLIAPAAADTQPTPAADAPPAVGFLYRTLDFEGETYAYSVYVPPGYTPDKAWPAILFLHGSGERGSDGFLQTEVGIGTAIRRHNQLIPAIVVMPQCRPKQTWVGPMGKMALACLKEASREYRCDPDRVYLTGLSLGGHGAWHLGAALPELFAAVVPICGFASYQEDDSTVAAKIAARLKDTPVWAFHGDADKAVPVAASRRLVGLLRDAGGEVQYTEYAGVGHNAWDKTYSDPALWRWLFNQRRGGADTGTRDEQDE